MTQTIKKINEGHYKLDGEDMIFNEDTGIWHLGDCELSFSTAFKLIRKTKKAIRENK